MNQKQLQEKKALLLKQISQQRQELSHTKQAWLAYSAPVDKQWHTIIRMRKFAAVAGGILIVMSLKKPARIVKVSKAALKIWGTAQLLQRIAAIAQKT